MGYLHYLRFVYKPAGVSLHEALLFLHAQTMLGIESANALFTCLSIDTASNFAYPSLLHLNLYQYPNIEWMYFRQMLLPTPSAPVVRLE
jgi:hypothetical protein